MFLPQALHFHLLFFFGYLRCLPHVDSSTAGSLCDVTLPSVCVEVGSTTDSLDDSVRSQKMDGWVNAGCVFIFVSSALR